MKAYENKNAHEVRNEAIDNGNQKLADLIWEAWQKLDELDYMAPWDEMTIAENIDSLREIDGQLADKLDAEVARAYC